MVGPKYHKPVVQTPAAYRELQESPQAQTQAASFADLPWWQVFQDPQLQELIRTALKQNYDMQLTSPSCKLPRHTASCKKVRKRKLRQLRSRTFPGGKFSRTRNSRS